jgi:hypothetical protein
MFDLEQSIAEWRRQMLAAGIKTPVPLEELEIHLREEIEQQIKSGLNKQKAFEISVARIGEAAPIRKEFKKNRNDKEKYDANHCHAHGHLRHGLRRRNGFACARSVA